MYRFFANELNIFQITHTPSLTSQGLSSLIAVKNEQIGLQFYSEWKIMLNRVLQQVHEIWFLQLMLFAASLQSVRIVELFYKICLVLNIELKIFF